MGESGCPLLGLAVWVALVPWAEQQIAALVEHKTVLPSVECTQSAYLQTTHEQIEPTVLSALNVFAARVPVDAATPVQSHLAQKSLL